MNSTQIEERIQRRREARCPRAMALRERLIGAADFLDGRGTAVVVGLLAVVRSYIDMGQEIPEARVEEIESVLRTLGLGPFPRPAA